MNPERLGLRWASFAYGTWRLSTLDRRLRAVVPAELYYNVSVTGAGRGSLHRGRS